MDGIFQNLEYVTQKLGFVKSEEFLKLIQKKIIAIEEFMENKWIPIFLGHFVEDLSNDGHLPIKDADDLRECLDVIVGRINTRRQELYGMIEETVEEANKNKGELK